jgi:hypothetical protein
VNELGSGAVAVPVPPVVVDGAFVVGICESDDSLAGTVLDGAELPPLDCGAVVAATLLSCGPEDALAAADEEG